MSDFNIDFFTLNISAPRIQKTHSRIWLSDIIRSEKKRIHSVEINFIFCNDEYLLSLNQKFLEKQTLTDVITFEYSEKGSLKGDVFISYERVKDNAKKFQQKAQTELLRVMEHGLLHLLGYKDKTPKEQKLMVQKENHYLALY
jgi:probable rRNA maturation factor